MSEKKIDSDKVKSMRRYRRAGLHVPAHKIKKLIKVRLPERKRERNVEVFIAAVTEFFLESLLSDASDCVKNGNFIDATHIHKVLNDGGYGNLLPKKIAGIF